MLDKTLSRQASDLAFSLFIMASGLGLHLPLYFSYASWNDVKFSTPTLAFLSCILGLLLGFVAFGGLSDRMGRRPVMMMAWVLSISSSVLMMMFPDARTLAITRFMIGLGTALMLPTAVAYMQALMANPKNKTSEPSKAIYWVTISTMTGICLGPALTSVCVTLLPQVLGLSLYIQAIGLAFAFFCLSSLPKPVLKKPLRLRPPVCRLPHFTAQGNWYGASSLLVWSMTVGALGAALGSQAKVSLLLPGLGLLISVMAGGGVCAHLLIRYMTPKQSARIGFILFLFAQTIILVVSSGPVLFLSLFGFFGLGCACLGFVFWGGLASACQAAGSEQARGSAAYLLLVSLGLSTGLVFFDDFLKPADLQVSRTLVTFMWFMLSVVLFLTRHSSTRAPKPRLTERVAPSLNMEQTTMGLDNVPTQAPVFVVDKAVKQRIRLTAIVLGVLYGLVLRIVFQWGPLHPFVSTMSLAFLALCPFSVGAMAVLMSAGGEKISVPVQIRQTVFAVNACYIAVILLALEGSICLVMASPLFFGAALLGGLVAGFVHNHFRMGRRMLPVYALLPIAFAPIESLQTIQPHEQTVTNTIYIAAPPEHVFNQLANVRHIRPEELGFTFVHAIGFPRPLEAQMDGQGVGQVRTSRWEKNVWFQEVITDWTPGQSLHYKFHIPPGGIPRDALDEHVEIGGEHFDLIDGGYDLRAMPDGGTELSLTTRFVNKTRLKTYVDLWAKLVFKDFHRSILGLMKKRAEETS